VKASEAARICKIRAQSIRRALIEGENLDHGEWAARVREAEALAFIFSEIANDETEDTPTSRPDAHPAQA
jgi:hypothetical protein